MSFDGLRVPPDVVSICFHQWRNAELLRQIFPTDAARAIAAAQRLAYEQVSAGRVVLQ